MIHPSTFSIVAYDPKGPAWGVAVASKFLAVGSAVPYARAGAGAVATQSFCNTTYGPDGLEMMAAGRPAGETLQALLAGDSQTDLRQVGIVDAQGGSATFTGSGCYDWAGGVAGDGFAAQGNILAGPQVVPAMVDAFTSSSGSLARRLYQALVAGDQTGGDRRGRQSAAILVVKEHAGYGGFNDRWVDLRVDDDPDPVARLGVILDLRDLYFEKSPPEDEVALSGEPLRDLQEILIRKGYYRGAVHGEYDSATRTAIEAFIGSENFEDRTDIPGGRIDRPVLEYLRAHFAEGS